MILLLLYCVNFFVHTSKLWKKTVKVAIIFLYKSKPKYFNAVNVSFSPYEINTFL